MSKKEKFMTNMECLLISKRTMRIWASRVTKAVLVIFQDLIIFGAGSNPREALKVFSEISKNFLEIKNQKKVTSLKEERILSSIWT